MILRCHKFLHLLLLVLCGSIYCEDILDDETKDDLVESESKDPSKVEIIKQIKRVNDDGSYTFGYEAEDGTFKIESRDVLGNIKGTFGFVDTDGEIKRVSYSTTNSTESATVTTTEKDRSSVIQQIPRTNRTTTRRPGHVVVTAAPSSTVIQSIPRRRPNNTSTEKERSYKKPSDFESRSTTETPVSRPSSQRPLVGHFIRSTVAPQNEHQNRYTEGQLIRPTQPDIVTPRPTENSYSSRRLIVTRNPYLTDDSVPSTIKPISEDSGNYEEMNIRGNLLRRQLNHEKISSNFDQRQHVLNLQQSVGDDSTDVYSASLTTGTPRPLFTTTDRSRIYPSSTQSSSKLITPAKYHSIYSKNRGPRPTPHNTIETTTDASSNEHNYAQPNQVQVIPIQNEDQIIRKPHPFHRGAYLIPVNQLSNGRFVIEDPNEGRSQEQHFIPQYAIPTEQQYYREPQDPRPFTLVPRRRPVPIPIQEYQQIQPEPVYSRAYPVPVPLNPQDIQDEIDQIKPPVSTRDFQKLLNRLIQRQSQLQEISRLESGMVNNYIQPERYRPMQIQPTPLSVYVRARPELRQNNGPVQFVQQVQNPRQRQYITVPQQTMQKLMESQPDPYAPENYASAPLYRSGRRVARLFNPEVQRPKEEEENTNYLPAEVREMLLLRMLQLAINPNLPLPSTEEDTMVSAIRQQQKHKKEAVRNVEILGEEQEDRIKPVARNKRYRESEEYDYYY